jgi:tetratricopeptide (TPR) repeat protein
VRHPLRSLCLAALALALAGCTAGKRPGGTAAGGPFYTPADPPSSRYVIDVRVDVAAGAVEGRETISLRNTGRAPIGTVAFDWSVGASSTLEVTAGGRRLFPKAGAASDPQSGPIMIALPEALAPGAAVELAVSFRQGGDAGQHAEFSSSGWYPRLWWDGLEHHDAFSVKLDVPEGVAVIASGRLDPKTGRYEAARARTFGLCLVPGLKNASRETDGVLITSYFTDKGAKAAAVCLETAADAVHFYKAWLGFYPFPFLNIIPGGEGRWGGYPVATGIVAIHGLETYVDGESPRHWRHITSHEIGHQYWGEWVLDADAPAWTWIAMGIFADTEFMTVRGFDPDRRAGWMGNYIDAIPMHYDMSLDAPPGRDEAVRFDFNNIVIHSKGPAAIFALDSVLGRDAFLRIYKRCLREFGGRRLGWRGLQAVAEAESGRNLAWFFEAWVRSNQYLCYGLEAKDCREDGNGGFVSEVRVKRLGTMSMPVPVQAVFEDGSTQIATTDRTRAVTPLVFTSRSRLRDVLIDPERKLARVETPVPAISTAAAAALAFGWGPGDAARVYAAVKDQPLSAGDVWYRLGSDLYGAGHLDEAAGCFARADDLSVDPVWKFGALGWRGLLDDLRGRRADALVHYGAALAIAPARPVRHDQYGITMDKAWVEERLRTPFVPGQKARVPERPTAAQLIAFVDSLNWEKEGETPLLVYRKTAGLAIEETGFWFKLGLLLYDSGYDRESLAAFGTTAALEKTGVTAFAARVWQGHMSDLLGNRAAALGFYKEALKLDPGTAMKHSQWGMTIDRAWVEDRLVSPFTKRTTEGP